MCCGRRGRRGGGRDAATDTDRGRWDSAVVVTAAAGDGDGGRVAKRVRDGHDFAGREDTVEIWGLCLFGALGNLGGWTSCVS